MVEKHRKNLILWKHIAKIILRHVFVTDIKNFRFLDATESCLPGRHLRGWLFSQRGGRQALPGLRAHSGIRWMTLLSVIRHPWHMAAEAGSWVRGQPGLHCELYDSLILSGHRTNRVWTGSLKMSLVEAATPLYLRHLCSKYITIYASCIQQVEYLLILSLSFGIPYVYQ